MALAWIVCFVTQDISYFIYYGRVYLSLRADYSCHQADRQVLQNKGNARVWLLKHPGCQASRDLQPLPLYRLDQVDTQIGRQTPDSCRGKLVALQSHALLSLLLPCSVSIDCLG